MAASKPKQDWDRGDIFQAPVSFLRTNERGVFECNPDVLRQLKQIDKQLVVIAITGKYRTGKSYLMNRLMGRNNGFPLGATIESKTKGIWIWCREHPYRSRKVIVLLDTEGLGDVRKVGGRDGDMKMMTLTLLLSSCFVYNIMSSFNTDALEKLDFVGHVASKMSTNHFPHFVLVVRDFSLELADESGRQLTPNQYLEDCLKDEEGENQTDMNKTRKFMRESFRTRSCHIFDRPCDRREQFKELENLSDRDLTPDFKKQSDHFVSLMFREAKAKRQEDIEVDGNVFCILVQKCIVDINNGCIPSTNDMFGALVKEKNQEAFDGALNAYSDDMRCGIINPQTEPYLEKIHGWAFDLAVGIRGQLLGPFNALEEMADQFEISIMEQYEEFKRDNRANSVKCLRSLLESMYEDLSAELEQRRFHNEWGFDNYSVNMEELMQNFYFSTEDYGGMRDMVFNDFLGVKEGTSKMLELNQQRCIEKRIQIKEEQKLANESARKAQAIERQHANIVDQTKRNEQAFQQNVAASNSRQDRDLRSLRSSHQRRLNNQESRLERNYREACARLERQHQTGVENIQRQRNKTEHRGDRLRARLDQERRRNNDLTNKISKMK